MPPHTMTKAFLTLVLFLTAPCTWAQSPVRDAAQAAREWRIANERLIVSELIEFAKIPNESRDAANIARNARHLAALMEKRGLAPRLLMAENSPPVVYGEWLVPGAQATYVFYAHYDGQPVLELKEWADAPFSGAIRDASIESGGKLIQQLPSEGALNPEWRVFGRGVADDKAGILTILNAVSAMRAQGLKPRANLKFVFEGEEETGSEHLEATLSANKDLLRSDGWIICDTPIHSSKRQNIVFGVRGVYGIELTVHTAARNLHSGGFGNWAPNAAMSLAQLLATMKDHDGRIRVGGFYDPVVPLSASEKAAIAQIPDTDAELRQSLKLGRTDGNGARLAELINLPTLNVSGVSSGKVGGQISTIIPASATASFDIRLVKGTTRAGTFAQLKAHIEEQGYVVLDRAPTDEERIAHSHIAELKVIAQGYEAVRSSMDGPFARKVIATVEAIKPDRILIPSSGGSLPLDMIERTLGVPILMVGSTNADNNQHAKNENVRLGNLWDGIEMYTGLMSMD